MSRTVIQQIDAPVPPLMVHLQRIQSDLNENGSLELVNIECWSDGIYKCSDEFTIIDRIKLNEAWDRNSTYLSMDGPHMCGQVNGKNIQIVIYCRYEYLLLNFCSILFMKI